MAKRSERLLALMQALRRRHYPVAGHVLAEETGVTLRSLYRDIETLKGMGAEIDGEPGIGFQLRGDYFLPPLMFSVEEIEALMLGLRTLVHGPDAEMRATALDAMAKLGAVLPAGRRAEMQAVGLYAIPDADRPEDSFLAAIRLAIRDERQVELEYCDVAGEVTSRTIYPVGLGYFKGRQTLVAWCTLRCDWRHFRTDRMEGLRVLEARLPEPRRTLLHRWQHETGMPDLI